MSRSSTFHAEQQALFTAMLAPSELGDTGLQPKHFSVETHADIFQIIEGLSRDGKPTDPVTVTQRAEHMGVKNCYAAMEIAKDCNFYTHATSKHYAGIIIAAWRERETRRIAAELIRDCGKEAAGDMAISQLMALHEDERRFEYSAADAARGAFDQIEAAHKAGGALVGIPSGLTTLDGVLGGFHKGDLIVVGARPAMGKTGFMQGAADAGCEIGPIGIISAEQPHEQLGMRWLASRSSISVGRLRAAKIETEQWGRLESAAAFVRDRPMRIFDRPGADIAEVCRVARRWKHQYGIRALYVDYIQRLRIAAMAKSPKHERVGEITSALKNLARELSIPVLALAQVSRKVDERDGQRPTMADLSDSSEIEKEADQILMLWRDKSKPHDELVEAEVIVEKNRHGNVGKVHCLWRGASTSFVDKPRDPDWMLNE
jgi:replicative DNA helicase